MNRVHTVVSVRFSGNNLPGFVVVALWQEVEFVLMP